MRRQQFLAGFTVAAGVAALLALLYLAGRVAQASLTVAPPFIAAFAIALLAEPLVERLSAATGGMRGRRLPAVLLVFLGVLLIFAALLTLLVPALVHQAADLASELPQYVQSLRGTANAYLATHHAIGPLRLPPNIDTFASRYSDQFGTTLRVAAERVAAAMLGSLSGLLNVVLVPIITFYLLVDLHRLRGRFVFLLPEKARGPFLRAASDVGGVFGNYVRGMVLVSVAYGVVATLVFLIFGLRAYALLLGVAAGLLYAVPFVGPFVTAALSCIVYLATGHALGLTAGLLVAILVQNQLFDNVVVPRVVGDSVGLHPLLTLFALFLGGELFGIWGMLLSVPVAASLQVILFRLFPRLREPTPLRLLLPPERPAAGDGNETVVRDAGTAEDVREEAG